MNEDCKFLYEKAIEGYQHIHRNFNHWMRMYAIFNSAMFVGLYTLKTNKNFNSIFLELLIISLGFVAGWLWHFSVRGFYRWITSWIGVIRRCEAPLNGHTNPYGIFVHLPIEYEKCIFYYKPFSTQKLTLMFTLIVSIAWSLILGWFLFNYYVPECCKKIFFIAFPISVGLFIVFCNILCREDLKDTHNHL